MLSSVIKIAVPVAIVAVVILVFLSGYFALSAELEKYKTAISDNGLASKLANVFVDSILVLYKVITAVAVLILLTVSIYVILKADIDKD